MLGMLPATQAGVRILLIALLASSGAAAQDIRKVEVVTQIGHSDSVYSIAVSPDGRSVASGSADQTIKLWDVATGRLLRTLEERRLAVKQFDYVHSIAFSPDGRSVVSGAGFGSPTGVRLWNAFTGRLTRTFEGHSKTVLSVAVSPDGRWILSGSSDKTLKLWDIASGRPVRTFAEHSGDVISVAFSSDGRSVLSASDKTVRLWNAATGELVRVFEEHPDAVTAVAFSFDGRGVLSLSRDGTLKHSDVASGRPVATSKVDVSIELSSVAFSRDGRTLLTGDGALKLWDTATGGLVRTFDTVTGWLGGTSDSAFLRASRGLVTSVAFSPDGRHVLYGSQPGRTLELMNAATGGLVQTFKGQLDTVPYAAVSPDGRRILAGHNTVKLWDATAGRLAGTFEGHSTSVLSVALAPDAGAALLGGKTLELWDTATGQRIHTFEGHSGPVVSVAYSLDGRSVLSGGFDRTIKLWNAATGKLVRTFEGHGNPGRAQAIALSPDGGSVLSGGFDRTIKLWNAATGDLVRTFGKNEEHSVNAVVFSPDGRNVLSGGGSDGTLKLWSVASGQLVRTFPGHKRVVIAVAFSPDGRRLLSAGEDKSIKVWDVASGRVLRSFVVDHAFHVAFFPDGRSAVVSGYDGTLRVFSLANGRESVRLHTGPLGDWLAVTPAGFFGFGGDLYKFAHLVRGLDVLSIGQVHQSVYNPDLVREALAGDPDGEVAAAAKVINLDKVVASGPPPSVAITSPADGSQSGADLATVTARIENQGRGVGRIEWRVNGITASVATKPGDGGPVYTVSRDLALDPGENTIEVVAYNDGNLLASLPARSTIVFTGATDKVKPKIHILAVGVDKYVDEEFAPPLDLAENDAKSFVESMQKAAAGLYGEVQFTAVLGPQATRANLERVIDRIAADTHPRDTFILFAAGHGVSSKGRFYLIPHDYNSAASSLTNGAIGQDQLQDWLANRIRARKAVILLDTCQSGALVAGHRRSRVDAPASEAAVGRLHEATGRPVLTAAAAGQDAIEGVVGADGRKHGVFTSAILDALRNGDANSDGLIELSELVAHVQSVVPNVAAEMGDKQAARFGSRGEDFVVARRLP